MEEPSRTPSDIERIVDRKLVRQRVHYYVVWKGFGEENNTWESRIDLMADGYSSVIKRFEDERKKEKKAAEGGKSTPRGRSPGRGGSKASRSKSPRRSVGRPRGRPRSRSRSASVARQQSEPESSSADKTETESASSSSSSTSSTKRRSKSSTKSKSVESSNNDENKDSNAAKTPKRQSVRKPATPTQFVSRLENEDESVLLRDTLASLSVPQVREVSATSSSTVKEAGEGSKKLSLSYEEEESVLLASSSSKSSEAVTQVTETSASSSVVTPTVAHADVQAAEQGVSDMLAKMTEGGWLTSFLSVAAVVGSLVASQLLPREGGAGSVELWRRWLPFLTPVVALLLFFHQKDARASAKWVATGLAWRGAAELLVLMGATPREFETLALGSVAAANASLVLSLISTLRHGEHQQSKSTLVLLLIGVLGLFLSDSWVVATEDPELDSRVILMSMAVLTIALSPAPTASAEEEDD